MRITIKGLNSSKNVIDYCSKAIPLLGSKSAVKKAITKGTLLLNHRRVGFADKVQNGDVLELKEPNRKKAVALKLDIPILFEDDYLLVVNKPGGIAVNGNRNKTLENALSNSTKKSNQKDALPAPVAAHRIDVPTKGLVVLAKTKTALIGLNRAFQNTQVQKKYLAIVHGKTPATGTIKLPIQGKQAATSYERLQMVPSSVFQYLSLLEVTLHTGRTHQIRIHLDSIGHLIVGDKHYAAGQKTILGKGLFLCSSQLTFQHPITKESVHCALEVPARFQRVLKREEERWRRKNEEGKR